MDHRGGDNTAELEFLLSLGSMTALALVTDLICKAGVIDRDEVYQTLTEAEDAAKDKRRVPLTMFHLMLELFEKIGQPVVYR